MGRVKGRDAGRGGPVAPIITADAAHQRRLLARLDDDSLNIVEMAIGHLLDAAEAEQDAGEIPAAPGGGLTTGLGA